MYWKTHGFPGQKNVDSKINPKFTITSEILDKLLIFLSFM